MKDKYGLTTKQNAFINAFLYDSKAKGNASASYRIAYNCENMTDNAIYTESSRLLNNPKKTLRIQQKNEEQEQKQQILTTSLADRVLSGLLLETEGENQASRIRAWELIGKTIPSFFSPIQTENQNTLTIDTAERELQQAISQALQDGSVVSLLDSQNKLLNNKDSLSPNMRDKKKA